MIARRAAVLLSLAVTTTVASASAPAGGLPQAGVVVATLPVAARASALFTSRAGSLFAVDVTASRGRVIEVVRSAPGGKLLRRRLAFALPAYLADLSAGRYGVYAGTSVIKRFSKQRDELIRIDAKTLRIAARAFFAASVGTVEQGGRLWGSLGDGRVVRLDPRSLAVEASRRVLSQAARQRGAIITKPAWGLGSLWVLAGDELDLELVRLDPTTLAVRSQTRIPTRGALAQALYDVVGNAGHVFLTGHAIAAVGANGTLLGRPVLVPNLESAAIAGNGLVGATSPPALVQLDRQGHVLARTALRDGGAHLTISGREVWLLGDAGQGEGIVHLRLRNLQTTHRYLASAALTAARCPVPAASASEAVPAQADERARSSPGQTRRTSRRPRSCRA